MMNEGKKFEQDFTKSLTCFNYRLRDAGGWSNADNTRFTTSNLCDMIIFNDGVLYLTELKSVIGKSLPKPKQLDGLCEIEFSNVYPCVIVNFRSLEQTYIIRANLFQSKLIELGKVSLNVNDIKEIGQLIPQQKIRTRYKYNF